MQIWHGIYNHIAGFASCSQTLGLVDQDAAIPQPAQAFQQQIIGGYDNGVIMMGIQYSSDLFILVRDKYREAYTIVGAGPRHEIEHMAFDAVLLKALTPQSVQGLNPAARYIKRK